MEQRSLKVLDTNKTFFSHITTTLTKILTPTKIGINNIMISIKRNNMIKAFNNYMQADDKAGTSKKEVMLKKYEEYYAIYLESIDKYIIESVYKKVKNDTATSFEKDALAKYYTVVSLKEKQYMEYKYRKQEYLINVDYDTICSNKKEDSINKYNEFYITKMDAIYKGILKNYSVQMNDNLSRDEAKNADIYDKVFITLETYVDRILPVKIKVKEIDNYYAIINECEKYESACIGKLDVRDKIRKKMILLGISRYLFTHSLPLVATEQCYGSLVNEVRSLIVNEKNKTKKKGFYELLMEVLDELGNKILSTKVYWDCPKDKERFKAFYENNKTMEKKGLSDDELGMQRLIVHLKYELGDLYKDEKRYNRVIKEYKGQLVQLGAMRQMPTKVVSGGKYKKKEKILE